MESIWKTDLPQFQSITGDVKTDVLIIGGGMAGLLCAHMLHTAGVPYILLTPTKPRCPHLGCALKWNRQEHSWDCPCHGSRFDRDGRLLDGPATGDTEL